MPKIDFEVNNLTSLKIDKKFLAKVAKKALVLIKPKISQLSIAIVCDADIRRLNKRYKGADRVTDVLAFNYGEIIICASQAKRQAKILRHSLKKELAILLIHGILHLSGQKDRTKKEFEKMNKKQEQIWQKITSSLD